MGLFFLISTQNLLKKTVVEFKNNFKLIILNTINNHQEALEIAKIIQLEKPVINKIYPQQVTFEQEALFYKGTIVLTEIIYNLRQRLIKLENDQFNYNIILQKLCILIYPFSYKQNLSP
jgi:LPS O-antigen subunit length determinant protein (WzzB/FepE family)